jgi:hypothetical protein
LAEPILIPVSVGELLDKKTILEIKRERMTDAAQLANVELELALLRAASAAAPPASAELQQLEAELRNVNAQIWDLENSVRRCEQAGLFGEEFVRTARAIYASNDRRAAIKRRINAVSHSTIVEEKSHN